MYKQFTYEQRVLLSQYLKLNWSKQKIADQLGVHKSSIYRELDRNSSEGSYKLYTAYQANLRSDLRAENKGRKSKITGLLKIEIDSLVGKKWSPEQIQGRSDLDGYEKVSHECIYQYIYDDKKKGGVLYKNLRQAHRTRRRRRNTYDKRGIIKDRISIEHRPKVVQEQKRYGDWEADTIVGSHHKSQIATLVERKSLFVQIVKLPSKSAITTRLQIARKMKKYKSKCHTITVDNGKEFADHLKLGKNLDAKIYFAHPYSAFERGCNENVNGLIRQYLPKKTDFRFVDSRMIKKIELNLNDRPRKKLGFKTPNEVFLKTVALKC